MSINVDRLNTMHRKAPEVKIINGLAVRFSDVCVYEFKLADFDDVDVYAAVPLCDWQQSEEGQWVMQNAVAQPYWTKYTDSMTMLTIFKIFARLTDENQTFWRLKWSKSK